MVAVQYGQCTLCQDSTCFETFLFLFVFQVEGKVVLQFAAAYGFRNIQNIVQKMKRKKCPYQYIEIMACPAGIFLFHHFSVVIVIIVRSYVVIVEGCVNGGGQIKAREGLTAKDILSEAERVYSSVRYICDLL